MSDRNEDIRPQPGYQMKFLSCPADVIVGGGAAGAGKTRGLLMDALRGVALYNGYAGVVFRQSYPEIVMPGGLWDETEQFYPLVGGHPRKGDHEWIFHDTNSRIGFRYLSNESQLIAYQGAQIPWIGWDELTHFSKKMFVYMLSRNRSSATPIEKNTKPIRGKIRATCNPDPDSWVVELVDWYIDQETGFPIPERAGVIRYFTLDDEMFVFGDTRAEVYEKTKHLFTDPLLRDSSVKDLIKSFTFIPGTIEDNEILRRTNPGYLGNLMAQSEETKLRLLRGNWKIRADKLSLFNYLRLNDMFDPDLGKMIPDVGVFHITIDHARAGRDLCVIGTWNGWKCIRIDIFKKSTTNDILLVVRQLRRQHSGIPISQIIIDQDGIGVKDSLDCRIFQGGGQAYKVKQSRDVPQGKIKAYYKNRRTQHYYLLAEKVNDPSGSKVWVNMDNVWLHHSPIDSEKVRYIDVAGKRLEVRQMIKDDLRTLKSENPDTEGLKEITSKELQKIALGGRSPDFGDMLMMRSEFEFVKNPMYLE